MLRPVYSGIPWSNVLQIGGWTVAGTRGMHNCRTLGTLLRPCLLLPGGNSLTPGAAGGAGGGLWAWVGAPAGACHGAASGHTAILSRAMSSSADMPPGSQFLASLVNYELTGLPPAAPSGSSNSPSHQAAAAAPITPHSPASGKAYDLQRMHRLLGALGDPHKRYPVLHVAGSKGKGSVVALLSSILRAAGYRVGTYSSPHLLKPQERIQGPDNGGAPISEERWEQLAQQVRAAAIQAATSSTAAPPDNSGGPAAPASSNSEVGASSTADMPTYFEATTAMALQHFADSGADVAVTETGMGGRDDATNVFAPEQLQAAVITTLGMEHVAALGGSIQTIAAAKAGIMKPGRPLVLAAQPSQEAAAVVLQYAGELGCPVVHAGDVVQVSPTAPVTVEPSVGASLAQQAISIAATLPTSTDVPPGAALQLPDVPCRLVGGHQHSNIQVAVAAALLLRQQGWEVPDAAIAAGLSNAWLPGRFQVMRRDGWPHHLVLDGAHTADSAAALASAVREAFPNQPLVLVLAMAADKEHREVIAALRGMRPVVVVFTAVPIAGGMQRAAPPGTLAAHWQAAAMLATGPPFRCRELIQASLGAALQKAQHELRGHGGEGVVVVTGSLHAVAAALGALD